MRAPIKMAIAFFTRESAGRRRKHLDWSILLGWTGIAIALGVIVFVLTR